MARWKPGQPLEIRSERFILRSLQPEDVDERLLGWLTDPELMRYLGGPWASKSVPSLRESIGKLYDNRDDFMLGAFHGERLIGCFWIDAFLPSRNATTHHLIGDIAYRGIDAPLECRAAMLDWLFRAGFERVEGRPYSSCIKAIRGYVKQGWYLEGVARKSSRDRAGKRHDNMLFSLLPEDWRQLRKTARVPGADPERLKKLPDLPAEAAPPADATADASPDAA